MSLTGRYVGLTFQLFRFRLKYAKVEVNQSYIPCRVSCLSGTSIIALNVVPVRLIVPGTEVYIKYFSNIFNG